jgi:hypothetical protein
MKRRGALLAASGGAALLLVALAAGCFQEIDPGAATGIAMDDAGSLSPDALTCWQLCQSPSCDDPAGTIPVLTVTPPIYLPDGGTTKDPCDDVEQASMAVRQTYCGGCHASPASQGGLGFVLNDNQLAATLAASTDDAGNAQRLMTPGDPSHSMVYTLVAQGLGGSQTGMPPLSMAGYTSIPRPSAADVSVLYAWILACAPGTDGGAYVYGGGDYAPDGGGAPPAAGDAATNAGDAGGDAADGGDAD